MIRPFGGMNFHTTQILSNYGYFRKFLYRIKKSETPICAHCKIAIDTAEHTLFECHIWNVERTELMHTLKCGKNITDSLDRYAKEKAIGKHLISLPMKLCFKRRNMKESWKRKIHRAKVALEGRKGEETVLTR